MKNVQIPEELFARLYGYFLLNKRDIINENIIKEDLQDKMNRLIARKDYVKKIEGKCD